MQGMSDITAPFLEVFPTWDPPTTANTEEGQQIVPSLPAGQSDVNTDWLVWACLSQLMRHIRGNFLSGMRKMREDISAVKASLRLGDPSLYR